MLNYKDFGDNEISFGTKLFSDCEKFYQESFFVAKNFMSKYFSFRNYFSYN